MRICSFVPGATEIVAALGLADSLVGRSHECDVPNNITAVPVLTRSTLHTGTMTSGDIDRAVRAELDAGSPLSTVDQAGLVAAAPDLIITQGLCEVCGITPAHVLPVLAALPTLPRLLTTSPSTLDDLLADIERVGEAAGAADAAADLTKTLRTRRDAVRRRTSAVARAGGVPPRVVCLEWLDPLYAAGHWVPEMVTLAGGQDVLAQPGLPSRPVTWEELVDGRPDLLFLMPCGFSISRTIEEFARVQASWPWEQLPAVRAGLVFAVDAHAYFSRPGPRLFHGLEILAALCTDLLSPSLPEGAQRLTHHPAESDPD